MDAGSRRIHPGHVDPSGHVDKATLTCIVRSKVNTRDTYNEAPTPMVVSHTPDHHRVSLQEMTGGFKLWSWTGGGGHKSNPYIHGKQQHQRTNTNCHTNSSVPRQHSQQHSLNTQKVGTQSSSSKYTQSPRGTQMIKPTQSRRFRDSIRHNNSRARPSTHSFRPSWCWTMFFCHFALLLLSGVTTIVAQPEPCSSSKDCHPPSENLLNSNYPSRHLSVSSTCGTPTGTGTPYRKSASTLDYTDYECNVTNAHPKEYMYDHQNEKVLDFEYENPKLNTYWQSMNTVDVLGQYPRAEWVVFNMTEPFLVRYIRIVFISPHILSRTDNSDTRPMAMAIERQAEVGGEWRPWRYYASDCLFYFSGVVYDVDGTGPDQGATTPVCQKKYYGGSEPVTGWGYGRQEVQFNPSQDYDAEFRTSAVVQRHFMATAVRLRLEFPADTEPLSSYYAIADLEVDGQCSCFGHASVCSGENAATCECHHNTEGTNCEKCQPLYNNRPWTPGALLQANACEDCECGGHATSCHYDVIKKYGVCDNCTDNTTGDKCHFCIQHFYVNPENRTLIPNTDTCTGFNGTEYTTYPCMDYCIPCNCSLDGSDPGGGFTCQNTTGQCLCKEHVEGRDCSTCRDLFYNLTHQNPQGCVSCDCEVSGTVNNTQLCVKDTGACVCKVNTQGHRCSECQPGYYGLDLLDPDGCRPCGCDPGAASNTTCPLVTGVCPCRPNIHGRTCRQPTTGFYVPALDHLTYDAEFTTNVTSDLPVVERPGHGTNMSTVTGRGFRQLPESSSLRLTVRVPRTTKYHVIARYETAGTWAPVQVTIQGNTPDYVCGGTTVPGTKLHQLEATLQPASVTGGADFGQVCLQADTDYVLQFELGNSDPRGQILLLDSVVLLPSLLEMPFFRSVSEEVRSELQACYQVTVSVDPEGRDNLTCQMHDYSVMAYLYDGAQECQCDPVGSLLLQPCDPMGGQCPCKAGVMLLDCSQCEVDHYGFSSGLGCTPCGCDAHGSVHTACNDTGTCVCQPNVHGHSCDQCLPQHFGLYTGKGCEKCTCNLDYSFNNSCEDTGQCHCQLGVGGTNCDYCLDEYYQLTTSGCTPCDCDPGGSTSLTCDKTTGKCSCKTLAVGDKCDSCQPGYFALGDWSPLGCLACYCSGHSSECNSASGWFLTNASNDWSLLMSATAIQEPWMGEDGAGVAVRVDHPVKIIGNEGQFVMQISNNGDNLQREDIFFLATDSYLGNKRSAYMHLLTFSLSMYIPDPPVNETYEQPVMTPSPNGDVILEGAAVDFRLVVQLPERPTVNVTEYSFRMSTEVWHVDTVAGPAPTYVQMIQILSDLSAIKIRAKYSNVSHSEVALYSALLTYAVNDNTSTGLPVNNVENCTCPKQYTGEQCESCSVGYTRLKPGGGAYAECVPCNCHGHGDPNTPCDPETGGCVCDHHTVGHLCDQCEDGYYGDPTRGASDACRPCTCPGNVVEGDINVFAHTCELGPQGTPLCHNCTEGHGGDQCNVCVNHWYGVPTDPLAVAGRCVPCVCHGRADTCNTTTGQCVGCVNNTAGQQCDICAPTFYGNAMNNACESCGCVSPGSLGDCNPRTGQCVCKENVVGFRCSECGPNSYNYTSGLGCQDCACHPMGSMDQQCNVTSGQCLCHVHLVGLRCDRCEDTYWNINTRTGCDPCECTDIGSLNVTGQTFGTCNLTSGQCTCARDAIIGRTCDYCAKGTKEEYEYVTGIYVGTYPTCELCGECFDNWGRKIDEVGQGMLLQYKEALHIWNHYGNMTVEEVVPIIGNLSANISLVDDSINTTLATVRDVRELQAGYNTVGIAVTLHQDELTRLEALLASAQADLRPLQQFDGTVTLPSAQTTTTSATLTLVGEVARLHDATYQMANASWVVIKNLTEAVRVSNGSVAVFVDRVSAAMSVLAEAGRMTVAATMILDSGFYSENANNTARLHDLDMQIALYGSSIDTSRAALDASVLNLLEGNETTDVAVRTVEVRMEEMTGHLETAQVTVFNATTAQTAANQALTAVNVLLVEANNTRRNLTEALVTVVSGIKYAENVTARVSALDTAYRDITVTSLRPLADMKALTSQIKATTVAPTDVQQLLDHADSTLAMAATAINITQTASNEAHKTMEEVRTIQHDLEEASLLQNQTYTLVNTVSTYNKTITATLNTVQQKAGLAAILADDVHSNISASADAINEIYRCFQDKQARSNTTRQEAQRAQATSIQAAQVHEENVMKLRNVTSRTEALEGRYTSFLQGILEVKAEVDSLLADVGIVSGASNVDNLLQTFTIQKQEMDDLVTELINIDREADVALANLDTLDSDTVSCAHA